jgi:signal transduction histidine kinase
MMLYLKAYNGDEKIQELKLEDQPILIGRSPGCELLLSDLSVSRKHARVEPQGNFYIIHDNHSTNGTIVNDRAIQAEVLHSGDAIRIGKFIIKVEAVPEKRGDTSKIRVQALPPELSAAWKEELEKSKSLPVDVKLPSTAAFQSPEGERLLRLCELQQELGYLDNLASLVDRSLKRMLEELDAEHGCVLLADFQRTVEVREPADLVPSAIAVREGSEEAGPEKEILVPEELIQFAIEKQSPLRLKGLAETAPPEAIGAPFVARGRLIGLVYLERRAGAPPFDDNDLHFLSLLASLVAINITNTLLFDEIFAEKEKLQAVVRGLNEGILVMDTEFRVIEGSSRAADLLGESENLVGKSFFELTGDYKHSISRQVIEVEIERGGCIFELEDPLGARALKVRFTPFLGNVSGFRGRIGFLSDASEHRRIEEKKIEFIRNVAHKLRTPLTLIEGNLPLLHGGIRERSPEGEILRDIEKGSRSLCELVDEFVVFMEMEIREVRALTPTQAIDLNELSWTAIGQVTEKAAQKRVIINNRIPGGLPQVRVQEERMAKAFACILENAVKFSPDGGVVTIDGEREGDVLRVHVSDEGPGIPKADQEAVFQVFHQVDEEGTGEVPGLGLGLSIARQIVQENGGDIQITSPFRAPDRGCRVTVLLTASAASGAAGTEPALNLAGERLG